MASITLRSVKGTPLTNAEVDANFTNLNNDKLEVSTAASTYLPLTGGTLTGNLSINSTGALRVSSGTTAQRPASPANGMFRYNSETGQFEGYAAGAWGAIAGGGGGGPIAETSNTISSNYTLSAGKNGFSVGPITIANGVAVTVPSGQRWVVI